MENKQKMKRTEVLEGRSNKEMVLPCGWEIKELGELGEVVSGLTYSPDMVQENGVLVLRSSNVQNRRIVFTDNVFIKKEGLKFNPVKKDDILICVRNGSRSLIGKNAKIDEDSNGLAFGAFMSVFRSDFNDYLFHAFDTDIYNKEIHVNLGATINSINGSDLKRFKIPLPPLQEQRAIANILSTWDSAINLTQNLISQKEAEKKWLMQNLLTGKKRLKGFEESNKNHITDLGVSFPLDWKILKVKEVFKERKETSSNQSEYPLFSLTIEKGLTEKTDRYERSFLLKDQDNNEYKLIYPNDILFNPMNLRFGAIAKSKINKIVSVSAYYNSIFVNKEEINVDFYEALFKTPQFFNLYERIAIGSLMEKKRVHLSNFLLLEIPCPTLDEQTAIAQVLQTADKEIEILKTKLDQQKLQKKGLMQVLLTGRVRVKNKLNRI